MRFGLGFDIYERVEPGYYASIQLDRVSDDSGEIVDAGYLRNHLRFLESLKWLQYIKLISDPAAAIKSDNNGAISKFYDLSGNDNDLTQSTTAKKLTAVTWGGTIFDFDNDLISKDGTSPIGTPVVTQHSWDGQFGGSVAIDEATTNELSDSEDLSAASWNLTRATVTTNDTNAPDGAATGDKLVEDTSSTTTHYISEVTSLSADQAGVFSGYGKPAGRDWINVEIIYSAGSRTEAFFDLNNGVVGTTSNEDTARIHKVGSYYRWELVGSPNAGENITRVNIVIADGDNSTSYTGDGSSGVHLWGMQLEAKKYATSYIPTSGSAASRAAGELPYPTSIISTNEGTAEIWGFVSDGAPHDGSEDAPLVRIEDADGAGRNYITIRLKDGNYAAEIGDETATTTTLTGSAHTAGWHKFSLTWTADKAVLYVDGSEEASASNPSLPLTFESATGVYVGSVDPNLPFTAFFNSRLDDLRIEKRALTAEEVAESYNADSPASEATRQVAVADGSDDFASIADNADLSVGDEDAFWLALVRYDVLGSYVPILSKGNPFSAGGEWELAKNGSDQFRMTVRDGGDGGSSGVVSTTFGDLSASTWYLVSAGHDTNSNQLFVQVNAGTQDVTATAAGVHDAANNMALGSRPDGSVPMNGQLGPVLMGKGYIPTAAEITAYKEFLEKSFGLTLS